MKRRQTQLQETLDRPVVVIDRSDEIPGVLETLANQNPYIIAPLDRIVASLGAVPEGQHWSIELVDFHPPGNFSHLVSNRFTADAMALGIDPANSGFGRLAVAAMEALKRGFIAVGRNLDRERLRTALQTLDPVETGLLPPFRPGFTSEFAGTQFWRIDFPGGTARKITLPRENRKRRRAGLKQNAE